MTAVPTPTDGHPIRWRWHEDLQKEAFTTALYVSVCLLAGLTAVSDDQHTRALEVVWGTTIGLALAHWFAFRLGARYIAGGTFHKHDAEAAIAQLVGAAAVAVLCTIPVVLFPESAELDVVRLELCGFIALVAYAVARRSGASYSRALVYGGTTLVLALVVVFVKNALLGH